MKEIKLTNTNQILKELDSEIKTFVLNKKLSDSSEYWGSVLKQLSSNYKIYISWSNINAFEEITLLEALFLLLDLPTRFLLESKDFEDRLYNANDLLDTKVQELFFHSAENMALINSSKIRTIDGWGNETENINVPRFINWTLQSRFTKLLENKPATSKRNKVKKSEFQQEMIDEFMQICLEDLPYASKRDMSVCIFGLVEKDQRFNRPLSNETIRKNYLKKYKRKVS